MAKSHWDAVDAYFNQHLLEDDPVLTAALDANARAELPAIDVSPSQGKLLYLLASMQAAARILEIGTLGGYSTIWLARALPSDGELVTLELERKHAEVARENIERAGLLDCVEIMQGPAVDSLEALVKAGTAPFDFVFIDADKESLAAYVSWTLKLTQKGSVIIIDNVVRDGAVVDPDSEDPRVQGVREMVALLAQQAGVEATFAQTVGVKGYDGFIVVRVSE